MSLTPVETHESPSGDYRALIYRDPDPINPREYDGLFVHVITADTHGRWLPVDNGDGGPLQGAWDRISWRPDAIDVFIRYARIFHGATVVEHHNPAMGPYTLWYVTAAEIEERGVGDPLTYVTAERDEYVAWAEGETYGFVVEERVVYERAQETGVPARDWMWRYEEIESLWGIYGFERAAGMAAYAAKSYEWL